MVPITYTLSIFSWWSFDLQFHNSTIQNTRKTQQKHCPHVFFSRTCVAEVDTPNKKSLGKPDLFIFSTYGTWKQIQSYSFIYISNESLQTWRFYSLDENDDKEATEGRDFHWIKHSFSYNFHFNSHILVIIWYKCLG